MIISCIDNNVFLSCLASPTHKTVTPSDVQLQPGIDPNIHNKHINDPQPKKPSQLQNNEQNQTLNNSTKPNQPQPKQEKNNSAQVSLMQKNPKQPEQPRESYRRRSSSENIASVTNIHVKDDEEQEKKTCCVLM